MSNRLLVVLGTILFSCTALMAPLHAQVIVASQSESGATLIINFPALQQSVVEVDGVKYTKISAENTSKWLQADAPDMLKYVLRLAIPADKDAEIHVDQVNTAVYTLSAPPLPSLGHLSYTEKEHAPALHLGAYYSNGKTFPEQLVTEGTPYIYRQQRGQNFAFAFTRYNAQTNALHALVTMVVTVKYSKQATTNISEHKIPQVYSQQEIAMLRNKFDNFDPGTPQAYTALPQYGDMLVICPNQHINAVQQYVDWKNRKGIRTTLVNTDSVALAPGDTLLIPQLQSFLAAQYAANPSLLYVQLVGDDGAIATQTNTYTSGGTFFGDNRYGYLSGADNYAELMVGRFFARNPEELQLQLTKANQYEQAPNMTGNWLRNFTSVASNDPTTGDDMQLDWEHQRDIADSMISHGNYTKKWELFDGSKGGLDAPGAPSPQMLLACVDTGTSFISYSGHGSINALSTTAFSATDCAAMINEDGKWPAVLVVGCNAGQFNFVPIQSLGHAMAVANTTVAGTKVPRGSIANAMSTAEQWWEAPQQCQDEAMAVYRGARPGNVRNSFGSIMSSGFASMIDQYSFSPYPDDGNQMTDCWQIFGDISVSLYNKNEGSLACTHPGTMHSGSPTFTVTCTVDDADIALSVRNKVLAVAKSNGGQAIFTLPTGSLGNGDTVTVTGTKYNYAPYFGTIMVNGWPTTISTQNQVRLVVHPNPAHTQITLNAQSSIEEVRIYNAQGVLVQQQSNTHGNSMLCDIRNLTSGMYLLQVRTSQEGTLMYKLQKQ
jgi:gingipain R